jgi:flap endonuclease-1
MGTNLSGLIEAKQIKIDELKGKTIAIDSFNMLYQFITTIRQPDGTPLMDSKGRVTSHLSGLFSRTTNLLSKGIRPIFVFDGKAPELKHKERQRRNEVKNQATALYEEAKQKEDVESMRKYAGRTARLTPDMVNEAKELLSAFGVPCVDAPSEGEAQVAQIVRNKDAYAGVSQDYDSLLHANPRIIRNLSIAGRRKRALGFVTISPEMIELNDVLNTLGLDQDRLICLSILVGTDYNIGGIHGIGPKKALQKVKSAATREEIFSEYDIDWKEIFDTIKHMPVTDDYSLSWSNPDKDKLRQILVERHEFSEDRIASSLARVKETESERSQRGLGDFF